MPVMKVQPNGEDFSEQLDNIHARYQEIIDGLNLYLMKNNGNIVFPGLYGYKCSMDLGTGSAGVLLALSDSGRSGEWGSWMPVLENEDFSLFRV